MQIVSILLVPTTVSVNQGFLGMDGFVPVSELTYTIVAAMQK
jgi:hypothetical protein